MTPPADPGAPESTLPATPPGLFQRLVPRPERGLWLLFLGSLALTNPYLRGDGVGYYAYLRSAVIDGDFDFENEYRRADPAFIKCWFDPEGRIVPECRLPNGRVRNQWAVGPSLLWSPFFLAAHGVAKGLAAAGADVPADGYSAPYRWACAMGTALYGFIGLLLARRFAERIGLAGSSVAATIGIWAASSLPVYMHLLPFQAHAMAAFTVSLFLFCWLRVRSDPRPRSWILWGLAGGLMIETYYLDGIFLAIPLIEVVRGIRHGGSARTAMAAGLAFGLATFAGLIPHFAIRWAVDGHPLSAGYSVQFFWASPRLWNLAFAPEHGLLLWTPILIPAAAGLFLLARRHPAVGLPLAAAFLLFYYVTASYQDWHGQSSFGSRFFVSMTGPFIAGLALVLDRIRDRLAAFTPARPSRSTVAMSGALVLFALWNAGMIFQWGSGLIPRRGPIDFAGAMRNQVTEVPRRAGGFLARYFSSRGQIQREIELQDLEMLKTYEWHR